MDPLIDTFSQPYKENMLEKAPNIETGMFYVCGGHECSRADTKEACDGNEHPMKHLQSPLYSRNRLGYNFSVRPII